MADAGLRAGALFVDVFHFPAVDGEDDGFLAAGYEGDALAIRAARVDADRDALPTVDELSRRRYAVDEDLRLVFGTGSASLCGSHDGVMEADSLIGLDLADDRGAWDEHEFVVDALMDARAGTASRPIPGRRASVLSGEPARARVCYDATAS